MSDQDVKIMPSEGGSPSVHSHVDGNSNSKRHEPEVATIRLQKSDNLIGINLVVEKATDSDEIGTYIQWILKGGAADLDGRLQAGDQLLKVDGHSLVGVDFEKSLELMAQTGPVVTLEVSKQAAIYNGSSDLRSKDIERMPSGGHQIQFKRLKSDDCTFTDAMSYVNQVKCKLENQPQVYRQFLETLYKFQKQSIDTRESIEHMSNIFHDHPELMARFKTFLPFDYRMEEQSNEQVQVRVPGTVSGVLGSTSLTTTEPPRATVHTIPQVDHAGRDASPHASPGAKGHQMQFKRLKSDDCTFTDAMSYVKQVKCTFENQPQVYKHFLETLFKFQKQSIDTRESIEHMSNIFHDHPELIAGFNTFLPSDYRIEEQSNEQVQVRVPGTVSGVLGPTSLTTTEPPRATVHTIPQVDHAGRDASPHASPGAKDCVHIIVPDGDNSQQGSEVVRRNTINLRST